MIQSFYIKPEFRANVAAHAISFFINILAYSITSNFFFLWVELASLCFIGFNKAKSSNYIDHNILNHFIAIIVFYLFAHLALRHETAYLVLIFVFTYIYFILKDNGFGKTFQLWMYIQALLIGTTFVQFSFQDKIYATVVGFLEAQAILNIAFYIFKNKNLHENDQAFKDMIKIPWQKWFSLKDKTVLLAMRGSISAAVLYATCISVHDLKPNWAVVVLISSLQRDDYEAGMRVVKGSIMGSLIGWPISIATFVILSHNTTLCAGVLWILLIVAFILSFEQINYPTLPKQVIITIIFLAIITCVVTCLNSGSYSYIHIKILNSIAGAAMAFLILLLWNKIKLWYNHVMV